MLNGKRRPTGGREFPVGKIAGRNESEPICSLVDRKAYFDDEGGQAEWPVLYSIY